MSNYQVERDEHCWRQDEIARDLFVRIMKDTYSNIQFENKGNYEEVDIDITGETNDGREVIYTAELKGRGQDKSNYDSILFQKDKYEDMFNHKMQHNPNRKYYYVTIWEKNGEIHFFNIDKIQEKQYEVHTINTPKDNYKKRNEKRPTEVYFIPFEDTYTLRYDKEQYN